MNPPSAIHSAMGRERKPFTYTPGGIDLSEIKSQRMAQRLMRNAMNQGVPEVPSQPAHSIPTTPISIPNFNCLPVQVFPTIQLPANPKSLLRTRSHPNQPKEPIMPSFLNPKLNPVNSPPVENKPAFTYSNDHNISRIQSLNEYENNNPYEMKNPLKTDLNSDSFNYTIPQEFELSNYYRTPETKDSIVHFSKQPEEDRKYLDTCLLTSYPNESCVPKIADNCNVDETSPHVTSPPLIEENNNNKQKDVRIVKKQATTKEKTIENGGHIADTEAAVTVKLPTKASAAKTETKVEVVQKTLPDGSVQEIKTTTTRTTIDGKTEIKTKTETKTTPKAEEVEEEEEVEESEEEVEENDGGVVEQSVKKVTQEEVKEEILQSEGEPPAKSKEEKKSNLVINEERSETTTKTAKKVVIVEDSSKKSLKEHDDKEDDLETEEVIENIEEKQEMQFEEEVQTQKAEEEIVEVEESEIEEVKESAEETYAKTTASVQGEKEIEEVVEKEKNVEFVEKESKVEIESDHEESEYTEEEYESEVEEGPKDEKSVTVTKEESKTTNQETIKETNQTEIEEDVEKEDETDDEEIDEEKTVEKVQDETEKEKEVIEAVVESETVKEEKQEEHILKVEQEELTKKESKQETQEVKEVKVDVQTEDDSQKGTSTEHKIPIREPSVPLEKVEEVEIKPITGQDFVTKSHTETTEITTSSQKPTDSLSKQTEYNRIENVVTVNRFTKTLDRHFEDYVQPTTIPSLASYFSQTRDISPARQIPKTTQRPLYTPEPATERRHSLLLERLSVERQLPVTEIYHNQYNTHISDQQKQWSEEPRSEVLTVGNVKPSTITKNQQWYQYSQKDNISNNVTPTTPATPSQQWNQPQPQYQPQYQPKPQPQTQPQVVIQPTIQSDQTYKTSFNENIIQDQSRTSSNIYNTNYQQNYSNYAPPKSDWSNNVPLGNQTSNYTTTQQYSTNTDYHTTQPYASSYVPPPWEQDSRYVAETANQTQYQPPPSSTFSPTINQSWQPNEKTKYTKPPPTAYIPPAPNQSFVKPVTPTPQKVSGRKTYYSEYERRYISVPEANYVPTETNYQHQPDPSPVYYYNNEDQQTESTEPEWRKELREFTEKSKTQTYSEQTTAANPPWAAESAKPPLASYTPTPTWSQTLRPRSYREKSYEAEFTGSQTQEWPKANIKSRSRPLSTYEKNDYEIPSQRVRGVSVDRYNPNNYQSPGPGEHPPVLSQTLTPQNAPHKNHPHVPAYHSRASAEPRDQPTSYKQPRWGDSRAAPVQSRSFKYLQWITGTED